MGRWLKIGRCSSNREELQNFRLIFQDLESGLLTDILKYFIRNRCLSLAHVNQSLDAF